MDKSKCEVFRFLVRTVSHSVSRAQKRPKDAICGVVRRVSQLKNIEVHFLKRNTSQWDYLWITCGQVDERFLFDTFFSPDLSTTKVFALRNDFTSAKSFAKSFRRLLSIER